MLARPWRVLDWGDVPAGTTQTIPWTCECGAEAMLPVVGRVVAVVGGGGHPGDEDIIFDVNRGAHESPTTIQCRRCGRVFTNKAVTPPRTRG